MSEFHQVRGLKLEVGLEMEEWADRKDGLVGCLAPNLIWSVHSVYI